MKARTSVALAREGRQRLEFHETKLIVSLIIHQLLTQIVVLLNTTFLRDKSDFPKLGHILSPSRGACHDAAKLRTLT